MRDVILRPAAEADIDDAADYTIRLWGREQALRYVADLRTASEQLADNALQYPLCEQVYPGLRRMRSGMHHIYYVASGDRVEIVRIIHVQRDPGRLLPPG
jgi:toxin ParE1/3/4